jgi:putative flippase GtrA
MSASGRGLRYGLVAAGAAGGDWLVFALLVSGLGVPRLAALILARLAGAAVSFLLNRHWTWKAAKPGAWRGQGARFAALLLLSHGLAAALFAGLSSGLGLAAYPAKLGTDVILFAVNFLVMNGWVFRAAARFPPGVPS